MIESVAGFAGRADKRGASGTCKVEGDVSRRRA